MYSYTAILYIGTKGFALCWKGEVKKMRFKNLRYTFNLDEEQSDEEDVCEENYVYEKKDCTCFMYKEII